MRRSPAEDGPSGKSPTPSEDLCDEKPVHFCSTADFQSTIRFTCFFTFSLHHCEKGERRDHVSDPGPMF